MLDNTDYVDVADRFNQVFADQGWFTTESFSIDTMREALAYHDNQHFEEAEDMIVEWFIADRIKFFAIGRCSYFGNYELRKRQLEEALELTQEQRYYSAVPLILIACEGFATDVPNVDLFRRKADLTLLDTFVGHPSALQKLVGNLRDSVSKTSEEVADLPMRHGILHGRTLGYATKSNCMKAWLLFIALTDLHIERLKEAEKPKEEPFPTELDSKKVMLMLIEIGEQQARLAQ